APDGPSGHRPHFTHAGHRCALDPRSGRARSALVEHRMSWYATKHPSIGKIGTAGLALAAALSIAAWSLTETWLGGLTYPAYPQMLQAAHTMEAATQVARSHRQSLGLL